MSKRSSKKSRRVEERAAPKLPRAFAIRVGVAFSLLAVARVIAAFFPDARLWGVNHLAFLPPWFAIAITVVAIVWATPLLYQIYQRVASMIFAVRSRRAQIFISIIVAVIAVVLFWSLRMETYFLGDGAVYIGEMYRHVRGETITGDMLFSTHSAPLTGFLYATIGKLLNQSYGSGYPFSDMRAPFWILGAAAGAIFVFASMMYTYRTRSSATERFSIALMQWSAAGAIFFFGYVEYYAFVFAALALYFWYALKVLDGDGNRIALALTLAIACAFHLLALVALPSLLLVIVARSKFAAQLLRWRVIARGIVAAVLLGAVYYFASGVFRTGSRNIISLFPFGDGEIVQQYTLLSSSHVGDLFNLFWLIAAPLCVAIVLIARREAWRDAAVKIFAVNLFCFLVLAAFGYASFGLARDWDFNAMGGLAFVFLFIALYRRLDDASHRSYLGYAVSGAALTSALCWLVVNLNAHASLERYKSVIALDAEIIPADGALNGYEHLRKWYFTKQDADGVAWSIQKKIERVGYAADVRALLLALREVVEPTKQKPYYNFIAQRLLQLLEKMKRENKTSLHAGTRGEFEELFIESLMQAYHTAPELGMGKPFVVEKLTPFAAMTPASPLLDLMTAQMTWDEHPDVVPREQFIRGGDAVRTSSPLCVYAGKALLHAEAFPEALRILRKGFALDSTSTLPLFYIAIAEAQTSGDPTQIKSYLENFLADPKTQRMSMVDNSYRDMVRFAQEMLDSGK